MLNKFTLLLLLISLGVGVVRADPPNPLQKYKGLVRVGWEIELEPVQMIPLARYFDLSKWTYLNEIVPERLVDNYLKTEGALEALKTAQPEVYARLTAGLNLTPPATIQVAAAPAPPPITLITGKSDAPKVPLIGSEPPAPAGILLPPPMQLILPGGRRPETGLILPGPQHKDREAKEGGLFLSANERYQRDLDKVHANWLAIPIAERRKLLDPNHFPDPEKAAMIVTTVHQIAQGEVRPAPEMKKDLPPEIRDLFANLNWSGNPRQNLIEFRHTNPLDDPKQLEAEREKFGRLTKTSRGFNDNATPVEGGVTFHVHASLQSDRDLQKVATLYNYLLLSRLAKDGRAKDAFVPRKAGAVVFSEDIRAKGLLRLIGKNEIELRVHLGEPKETLDELLRFMTLPEEEAIAQMRQELNNNLDAKILQEIGRYSDKGMAFRMALQGMSETKDPAHLAEARRGMREHLNSYFLASRFTPSFAQLLPELKRIDPSGGLAREAFQHAQSEEFRKHTGLRFDLYKVSPILDARDVYDFYLLGQQYAPEAVPKEMLTPAGIRRFLGKEPTGAELYMASKLAEREPSLKAVWLDFIRNERPASWKMFFEALNSSPLGKDPQIVGAVRERYRRSWFQTRRDMLASLMGTAADGSPLGELAGEWLPATWRSTQELCLREVVRQLESRQLTPKQAMAKMEFFFDKAPALREQVLQAMLRAQRSDKNLVSDWLAFAELLKSPRYRDTWLSLLRNGEKVPWFDITYLLTRTPLGEDPQTLDAIRQRVSARFSPERGEALWAINSGLDGKSGKPLEKLFLDIFAKCGKKDRADFASYLENRMSHWESEGAFNRLLLLYENFPESRPEIVPALMSLTRRHPNIDRAWAQLSPILHTPQGEQAFLRLAGSYHAGDFLFESLQAFLAKHQANSPLIAKLAKAPKPRCLWPSL